MKQLRRILKLLLWSHIGVFAGYTAYGWWHYKTHPALYTLQSTPWYTSIQILALSTLAATALLTGLLLLWSEQ